MGRKTWAWMVVAALGCTAAGAEVRALTVPVGPGAPTVTVTHEKGTVEVKEGDSLIQKISYDQEIEGDLQESGVDLVQGEDMNFDGFLDLRITESVGVPNAHYACLLWNHKTKKFEKNEELGGLSNPEFDPETKKIKTFEHARATDNIYEEYEWREGTLTVLWRKIQGYDDERERFFVREERRKEGGEMVQESEHYMTEAALEIYLETGEIPLLDEALRGKIALAAKALLGAELAGEGELHGVGSREGQPVRAWVFPLTKGEEACFETSSGGALYLNKGDRGAFAVHFDGNTATLGEKVD